jgi:hypothetical protein
MPVFATLLRNRHFLFGAAWLSRSCRQRQSPGYFSNSASLLRWNYPRSPLLKHSMLRRRARTSLCSFLVIDRRSRKPAQSRQRATRTAARARKCQRF